LLIPNLARVIVCDPLLLRPLTRNALRPVRLPKSQKHLTWIKTKAREVIFASFGLFAPCNGSIFIVMFVCALPMAGSVYLIVEMDQPYSGLIEISSAPRIAASGQLGQP
jgi:hypothetical protein